MHTKTLGPFTGRQLTTIICVVAVTLLLPVAAWSVTASHVIVDSGTVAINGQVAANVSVRSQFVESGTTRFLAGSPIVLLTPPAGKGLVITTMHMTWFGASGTPYVHLFTGAQGTCAGENISVEWDLAGAQGSQDAPMTPGYVVPDGKALCAHMGGTGSIGVNVYGYLFAAGTIPTPQLAVGTAHTERP